MDTAENKPTKPPKWFVI